MTSVKRIIKKFWIFIERNITFFCCALKNNQIYGKIVVNNRVFRKQNYFARQIICNFGGIPITCSTFKKKQSSLFFSCNHFLLFAIFHLFFWHWIEYIAQKKAVKLCKIEKFKKIFIEWHIFDWCLQICKFLIEQITSILIRLCRIANESRATVCVCL